MLFTLLNIGFDILIVKGIDKVCGGLYLEGMSNSPNIDPHLRIADMESAVERLLCDYVANGARHISMSALLDSTVGDSVTVAEGVSWLMKYSPEWKKRAKEAGV